MGFSRRSFNTFSDAGPDPRERYRKYLGQTAMTGDRRTRRMPNFGGAIPTAMNYSRVPTIAEQIAMLGAGAPGGYASPTADALDSMYDRAEQDEQQFMGNGIQYSPGFQAPGRRLFARRGFRGMLYPQDEIRVHDGETVQVNNPADVTVIPKDLQNHPAVLRQRRQFDFQDKCLHGAPIGQIGSDQYDQIASGELAPYAATSPAARRAGYALYQGGANPIREHRKRMAQPDPARVAEAQRQLEESRNQPANHSGRPSRDQVEKTVEEIHRRRLAGDKERGENLGLDGPISINQLLTQRAQDRHEAVERFGSSRPTAIGEMKRERRMETLQDKLADAESRRIDYEARERVREAGAGSGRPHVDDVERSIEESRRSQEPRIRVTEEDLASEQSPQPQGQQSDGAPPQLRSDRLNKSVDGVIETLDHIGRFTSPSGSDPVLVRKAVGDSLQLIKDVLQFQTPARKKAATSILRRLEQEAAPHWLSGYGDAETARILLADMFEKLATTGEMDKETLQRLIDLEEGD